ncbi:hypothetical protein L596_029034 [Steinernema carpocapsae]|uniref:Uncharacterized protein n=1 Tax=Steinernema carpocapsae TaxID=34508 RepID=A0A4U5LTF7_STECR|nr:hypothetical protein L596_029034 [Steinernema carpocapsae]
MSSSLESSKITFCSVTRTPPGIALRYLKHNGGDLQDALNEYYSKERTTYINVSELKRLGIVLKLPVMKTLYSSDPQENLVNGLLQIVGRVLENRRRQLPPRLRVAIYVSAIASGFSDEATRNRYNHCCTQYDYIYPPSRDIFKETAAKFSVSLSTILPIILEVSRAVNTCMEFRPLSSKLLHGVSKDFERKTGFPRVAGAVTYWKNLTLLLDSNDLVIAASIQPECHHRSLKFLEKWGEALPKPEPLNPHSKKVEHRFIEADYHSQYSKYLYEPYFEYFRVQSLNKHRHFNKRLKLVLDKAHSVKHELDDFYDCPRSVPEMDRDEVALSCIHVYNFMKKNNLFSRKEKLRRGLGISGYTRRVIFVYLYQSAGPEIDLEKDLIAEYLFDKK